MCVGVNGCFRCSSRSSACSASSISRRRSAWTCAAARVRRLAGAPFAKEVNMTSEWERFLRMGLEGTDEKEDERDIFWLDGCPWWSPSEVAGEVGSVWALARVPP